MLSLNPTEGVPFGSSQGEEGAEGQFDISPRRGLIFENVNIILLQTVTNGCRPKMSKIIAGLFIPFLHGK